MSGAIWRIRNVGLLWPTIFMLGSLAVLVSLGAWQWQRMEWKNGLERQLKNSESGAPETLQKALSSNLEVDSLRFRRMRIRGRFLHDAEFHVWSPEAGGSAWRIVTPFAVSSASGPQQEAANAGPRYVLVIRGTVPDASKETATRAAGQVAGEFDLTGRVRFSSRNWATPEPDIDRNRWYALDADSMRRVLAGKITRDNRGTSDDGWTIAPFFIEAEKAAAPPPAPQPKLAALSLRNRHLEYALTWWGLAVTLVGVYAAFAAGRLRRGAP